MAILNTTGREPLAAPIAFLHECFVLRDDGALVWRARPEAHFSSPSNGRRWNARYTGKVAGRRKAAGYIVIALTYAGRKLDLLAHRIVWAMSEGEWPTALIDHRDRDPSNNRRSNLRPASVSSNNQNQPRNAANTSGYKGVSRNKERWLATIRINGKKINLGRFSDPAEAGAAYQRAAQEHHGDFACW